VPRDRPARFIREFVDGLDLRALGFVEHESEEGRPPCAKDLLLKVWVYGYPGRMRATRQLERARREHRSLIWLTGRHAPDHNTLWRFWVANRKALRGAFQAGSKVAAAQLGEAETRGQEVLVAPGVETGGAKRGEFDGQQCAAIAALIMRNARCAPCAVGGRMGGGSR
jgi:hypothetical protein